MEVHRYRHYIFDARHFVGADLWRLPQEPPGRPPKRGATHRPRGGKANRRKARREAKFAEELAKLSVPLLVDLTGDEEESAAEAAPVRSSASSTSAAAHVPGRPKVNRRTSELH